MLVVSRGFQVVLGSTGGKVLAGGFVSELLNVRAESVFFFQAEDGIRVLVRSRGLGDVYKRQTWRCATLLPGKEKIQ